MNVAGKTIFLYMNFFKDDDSIGITKKIKSQIRAMREMGLKVYYTSYVEDGAVVMDNSDSEVYKKKFAFSSSIYQRYDRRFLLIATAREFVEKTNVAFDIGYLRWHTFDKAFLNLLKTLKEKEVVNIIEAHAWTPNRKVTSLISRYQIFMDDLYSKKAKDYVSLVAGISEYDNIWGIKTVKIDNAIDLDSIKPREWNKNDEILRIISVSNEYSYHGYDRLLKGIKHYYDEGGSRKIEVHFIGVFLESTRKLTEDLDLNGLVHFHGKQFGTALDDLYDNSDLGIGALAHHRVGMYAGSSLKTKEYFAKGLPFIYGWKEPAFDETYPYAHRIKLCEEPIDIPEILSFYDGIKDDPNMLINMREFAAEHYVWRKELNKVFEAL